MAVIATAAATLAAGSLLEPLRPGALRTPRRQAERGQAGVMFSAWGPFWP